MAEDAEGGLIGVLRLSFVSGVCSLSAKENGPNELETAYRTLFSWKGNTELERSYRRDAKTLRWQRTRKNVHRRGTEKIKAKKEIGITAAAEAAEGKTMRRLAAL